MLNNETDLIQIARALQHSLTPLSAAEVKSQLEQSNVDLASNAHASVVTEIQAVLESMPSRRVEKLVSPSGENKYRWVFQWRRLPCSSLVAMLEGITSAG